MTGSCCLLALSVLLQTPSKEGDSDLVKRWLAVCQSQAEMYRIGPMDADQPRFQRVKEPIFRHATPARGNDIGSIYLWVDANQRPAAVIDFFAWSINNDPKRQVVHECHSLAAEPMDVVLDGRRLWKPNTPGLKWEPVPGAPAPAAMKSQRARQARELAQQFTANSLDDAGGRWELRVLPQPVYQYEATINQQRQSGAMFAMCQGTDPEVWLLLETRPAGSGEEWTYACASFTDYALQVRHDGKEVWSCPKYIRGDAEVTHWIEGVFSNITAPPLTK